MAHVLVIGGAGGLGLAVVKGLGALGHAVSVSVMNDAEEALARSAAPMLRSVVRVDLADADATHAALSAAVAGMDSLDGVIVCAAIAPLGPLETTPINTLRRTLEINATSSVAIYQATLPALRKTGGRIIFVSSMAGVAGMPFIGAYVASKFALEGAADVMRREAAPQGVSVVIVEPGAIKTPMVDAQIVEVADRLDKLSGEEADRYGYLYKAFKVMATQSHHEAASSPEAIAETILEAFGAQNPAARYVAGDDAGQVIALAKSGDEALDAAFAGMYAQAAAAADA